ncbi:hypothetical protein ACEN4B_12275, partial [Marinilactibacillus psychrotolerans]|uniref:hypothetical protein n=1 Tax=Marinilactibacillus psychrotolerans TaxID=191770 RepID=UPI0038882DEE
FASDFLQIPPHDGHPCHSLTVPTAKPVVDFHHQVVAHAGRTNKKTFSYYKMDPIEWTLKKVPSIGSIFVYLYRKI